MPRALRTFLLLGFSLLLVILASDVAMGSSLKGKVKKKVYHSPENNFTIPVPPGSGMKISDDYVKQAGMGAVSFHDDLGRLKAIHYMDVAIPDGTAPIFENAVSRQQALKDWFYELAMPSWFLAASPESRVLAETLSSFKGMDAVLVLVRIPQGHHLVKIHAGKSTSGPSRRGLVIFFRGQYIYMLASETLFATKWWEEVPPEPKAVGSDWMNFVTDLESFYDTINFVEIQARASVRSQIAHSNKPGDSSSAQLDAALAKLGRDGDATDLKALLASGLDINARDGKGKTPLMAAARGGDAELLRVLLERGAGVNARDQGDSTALGVAAFVGHLEIVLVLLEAGAEVNVHNEYGHTALMVSVRGDPAIIRMLLGAGADIDAKYKLGGTALFIAANDGHLAAVETLLEAGADVNVRSNDGETALRLAKKQGHKEIVKLLKNAGAKK